MIPTGIFFAFLGYAFTDVLMDDLLWKYRRYLVVTEVIPEWLKKPLGLCNVCFTGQLSFWGMLPLVNWTYVSVVTWLGLVSLNMIIILILNKYVSKEN